MNANFPLQQAGDAARPPRHFTRHFSDTRTGEGRVRFLLSGHRAELHAEGPGWSHRSAHPSLQAAATFLAAVPQVSQSLYEEALTELERRLRLERAA